MKRIREWALGLSRRPFPIVEGNHRHTRFTCHLAAFLAALLASFLLPIQVRAHGPEPWTQDLGTPVYSVAIDKSGSTIFAGRRDNRVQALDQTGTPVWEFATQGTVYGVAASSDGTGIAVASEDRNVYLLDATGKEVWKQRGTRAFTSVSISQDGAIIVAGGEDRNAWVIDKSGTVLWKFPAGDTVTAVAVYGGANAFRVIVGTRDSRVRLLNATGELLWEERLSYPIRGISVTPDGRRIAVGQQSNQVVLLDGANGSTTREHDVGAIVHAVALSTDGEIAAAATQAGDVIVFRWSGEQLDRKNFGTELFSIAMASDSRSLVVGSETGIAYLVPDPANGTYRAQQPQSFVVPALAAGAVLLLTVGAVLSLRRTKTGERAGNVYAREARHLAWRMWRSRISYLFLAPTVILLVLFNYYPAISGIGHAFTAWNPGIETRWVGLQNFESVLNSRYFWIGIGNAVILIATTFLKLCIPLLVAEMIFHISRNKVRYLMRTLFVIPLIVPGVVAILLWVNIYDPNIGLANQLLRGFGLESLTRVWLGDERTALGAVLFIGFPWVGAFALLIFYGGLISIPTELFDAAQVDGASGVRRFFSIDLPLLLGQIRLLLILGFIAGVQEFAAVFLTTGGGPGSATYLPALELYYQAVRFNNFGLASAMGAVLFLIILGGTILNLRYVRSSVEYNA